MKHPTSRYQRRLVRDFEQTKDSSKDRAQKFERRSRVEKKLRRQALQEQETEHELKAYQDYHL